MELRHIRYFLAVAEERHSHALRESRDWTAAAQQGLSTNDRPCADGSNCPGLSSRRDLGDRAQLHRERDVMMPKPSHARAVSSVRSPAELQQAKLPRSTPTG
jgi:hypothetical protein